MTKKRMGMLVGVLVVGLGSGLQAQIYWTGWEDSDWTNANNWAVAEGEDVFPAEITPGPFDQANLWEVAHPDTAGPFNGSTVIPSGVAVEIFRLEWRCCKFVGPDPVSVTVEGSLTMPSAAFGNFSIASTMTIPEGGVVDVTNTFWLAQNYDDAQSPDAAANGGANLNVDGGMFFADSCRWGGCKIISMRTR